MARRSVPPLLTFLVVLLVGCQRAGSGVPPTPTLDSTFITFATFTPDGSAGSSPQAVPGTNAMSNEDLIAFIESHLVEYDPRNLISELERRGYGFEPSSVVREDLNGDGEREWAMFVFPPTFNDPEASALFVIIETVNQDRRWSDDALSERLLGPGYRLAYYEEFHTGFGPGAELLTTQDISGDGLDDILMHVTGCGAHSCITDYSLVSYHDGSEPRELLQSDPLSGSAPGAQLATIGEIAWRLRDWDGDGRQELLLLGNYRGNIASGPQRGIVEIYGSYPGSSEMMWQGGAWLPSDVRYFHLRDGDLLIGRQMFQAAIDVLDEVVDSEELEESGWSMNPSEPRDENGDVRRFAYLRLMQAAMLLGDRPLAKRYLDEMAAAWPEHPLTGVADYMLYAQPTDFWAACEKVAILARAIPDLTGSIADMGMSNPPITNEHFCPIRGFGDVPVPLLLPRIDYDPAILP